MASMVRAYMLAGVVAMAAQATPVVGTRLGGHDLHMRKVKLNMGGAVGYTGRALQTVQTNSSDSDGVPAIFDELSPTCRMGVMEFMQNSDDDFTPGRSGGKPDGSLGKPDRSLDESDRSDEESDRSDEESDISDEESDISDEESDRSDEESDQSKGKSDRSDDESEHSDDESDHAEDKSDNSTDMSDHSRDKSDHSDDESDNEIELAKAERCGLYSSSTGRPTMAGETVKLLAEGGVCDAEGSVDDFGTNCADVPEALGGFLCMQASEIARDIQPVRDAINGLVSDGDCTQDEGRDILDFFVESFGNPIDWALQECDGAPHPCFGPNTPLDLEDLRKGGVEAVTTDGGLLEQVDDGFYSDVAFLLSDVDFNSTAPSVVSSVTALGLTATAFMA